MTIQLLLCLSAILHMMALKATDGSMTVRDVVAAPGDAVFGTAKVVQLHLEMSDEQFAALNPAAGAPVAPPGFGRQREQPEGTHRNTFGVDFPWAKGDLKFDGETYKDVGVRYKGNYTFMATSQSLKKSIKLDLNRFVKGQKLDGLTMLNLHCGVSDRSRTRETLSFAFFREAGVPAPRTSFAELTLTVTGKYDAELVGIYALVEQVNKEFLKRHFKDGNGMLLKPEGLHGGPAFLGSNWTRYQDQDRPESPPTDEQKKRLIEFTELVGNGTDEAFASEIDSYLDTEAFLKFIAANTQLSNLDSYLGYGHNYYLYLVPRTNKFAFIPWDLDLSLATWPAVGTPEQLVELSINHSHAGKNTLIDRLFAIERYKDRYTAIIRELTSTSFTKTGLFESLDEIEKALQEPMAREATAVEARQERGDSKGFGAGFGGGQFGQSMPPRKFVEMRTASVAAQLAGEAKGFDPKPIAAGFGPPPRGGRNPAKNEK